MPESPPCAKLTDAGASGVRTLLVTGDWITGAPRPEVADVLKSLDGSHGGSLAIDATGVGRNDSLLPAFLLDVVRHCGRAGVKADYHTGNNAGLVKLLDLALSVPEAKGGRGERDTDFFSRVGGATIELYDSAMDVANFTGQSILSFLRLMRGKAIFRKQDFWLTVQECGANALPIVSLIAFLVGMIFAFVGKAQLEAFGASIYVANLVAIAMVREMGCLMAGIIMSGRTGAAFAAQIGSMKVNQEVDALVTFAFKPFDFLVLPRMLALIIMLPLLTIYADIVGIIGGMLVSWMSGTPLLVYYHQSVSVLSVTQMSLGVFKGAIFGIVVAGYGCLRGMQSGNSSSAVGTAATRAVVSAITAIIVIDCFFAVLFTIFNI